METKSDVTVSMHILCAGMDQYSIIRKSDNALSEKMPPANVLRRGITAHGVQWAYNLYAQKGLRITYVYFIV